LKNAISLVPENVALWLPLGNAYLKTGKLHYAERSLKSLGERGF